MTEQLEIHPASPAEQIAAHRNVFDIWSKGLPLEEHLRWRQESPSHSRATWFVGCLGERVVTSLGCYPIEFLIRGQRVPGIAIGSVYTLGEYRGRGFAPRLIRWVEAYQRERQIALSALYSDIDPNYYAALGYHLCPSPEGELSLPATPVESPYELTPISAENHLPRLQQLYSAYHGTLPLSIARDEPYWRSILKKFGDDQFYAFGQVGEDWRGYVRVGRTAERWRITDFALADHSAELAAGMYQALVRMAQAQGVPRVAGWLPPTDAARKFAKLAPRSKEITMLKPLAYAAPLTEDLIAAAGQFCEIDHV